MAGSPISRCRYCGAEWKFVVSRTEPTLAEQIMAITGKPIKISELAAKLGWPEERLRKELLK